MGRLTQKDDKGNWSLRNIPWGELFEGRRIEPKARQAIYGALCKLKDYEDTGLEPGDLREIDEEYQKLAKEVAGLREKERWIPCSERLPEEKINPITQDFYEYQVTFQSENIKDIRYYKFGRGHWWNGSGVMDEYVTAWKPLPEPYHES